jgi:acetyltransferase-like isoleucine patch superfamily enzyme
LYVNAILFGLVFLSPPFLKAWLLRAFAGARIHSRAHIGWFSAVSGQRIEMGAYSVIRPLTLLRMDGEVSLGAYAEISSFTLGYGAGGLHVGEGSYIGPQSMLNCEEDIRIGRGSALGARSMVYTHGSFLPYTEGYWVKLAGVTVGDKVWCAAGVFLQPGAEIGDNSFVNSMSVVSGSIPPGSVVEGNPARVVAPMERLQRKMTPKRLDLAVEHILRDFVEIGLRRELRATGIEAAARRVSFAWRGQRYVIVIVPSEGEWSLDNLDGARLIGIVNRPGWQPPVGALTLDLDTLRTSFNADPLHTALRLFFLRYYGVRFRDEAE